MQHPFPSRAARTVLRFHLRTLFGIWHLAALGGLAAAALLLPTNWPDDIARLRWLLTRSEVLGPLFLMPLVGPILLVQGRVDERWGTNPGGLGARFLQRWVLVFAYYAAALGLFLALAGMRVEPFLFWRMFLSGLVTAALFSLAGPLVQHVTGSAAAGWAGGLGLYFLTVIVAQFWCPHDPVYQIWLPFAGQSDAGAAALLANKAVYGLTAVALMVLNLRVLQTPERLIGRSD